MYRPDSFAAEPEDFVVHWNQVDARMISQYLDVAMRRAHYEIIDDPEPFYGEIRECQGVWATGKTLEECRQALLDTLEGWLVLSLQKGLPIPALDGISLLAPEPTEVHG